MIESILKFFAEFPINNQNLFFGLVCIFGWGIALSLDPPNTGEKKFISLAIFLTGCFLILIGVVSK